MSAIVAESYERSVITNKSHPYKIVSVYVLYTVDIVDILDVVDYMLYILCNYENTLHMLHIALQPATYAPRSTSPEHCNTCCPSCLWPWCLILGSRPSSTSVIKRRRFLHVIAVRAPRSKAFFPQIAPI